jgi:hypothetical protein
MQRRRHHGDASPSASVGYAFHAQSLATSRENRIDEYDSGRDSGETDNGGKIKGIGY